MKGEPKMANTDIRKQSDREQESRGGQVSTRRGGGLSRREDWLTSPFSWSPGELFRLNPFELMRRFSEDMDRAFTSQWQGRGQAQGWSPAVEVREHDGKLEVCADLPGLKQEDVKVEVTDEGLVIQGERKREHEENREGYHRSERSYGQFYRLIPLPEGANVDQANAEFHNGELRVTVPLAERTPNRRQIPIGSEKKPAASQTATAGQSVKAG